MKKTLFYSDEIKDDFAFVIRKEKTIPDNYRYINKNIFYLVGEFIVYRIIMWPFAFIFSHFKHHVKIKNKKVTKIKGGYFLYGNHTQIPGDAFFPNLISFPKKSYVIVHPDSVAMKGTETFVKMSGALPIPTNLSGLKNFMEAIKERVEKHVIVIYPEAHVWPYYTKIRAFQDTSFKYPIKLNKPTFCYTTVYKKRRLSKKPRAIVYVDGPFYADKEKPLKQQQKDLCDMVYAKMVERAKESNIAYVQYIKRGKQDD